MVKKRGRMRQTGFFLMFLFLCASPVKALTVQDVRVVATADSLAAAREKALDEGHRLAYKKIVEEAYPESFRPTPPHDRLMDMVTTFSIDREKPSTDNKTYTASLTFQFDNERLHNWIQGETPSSPERSSSFSSPGKSTPLKIKVSYGSHDDWRHIKKTLEALPEGQSMKILSLSSRTADISLPYGGEGTQAQQRLKAQGLSLVPVERDWTLSLTDGHRK